MLVAEWQVVWVPDSGRWGSLPSDGVLGVKALPAEVARIGLQPGDPVFVSPDFTVDSGCRCRQARADRSRPRR
jgi:hypothetical protein